MSLCGIKIARVYEVQRSSSVPLDDSDDDIQESIWYKIRLITKRDGRLLLRYFCVGSHQFKIDNYKYFTLLEQSAVAGQEAIMYVSSPWRSVLSVVLQA
jgi:hypothetical protein